MEVLELFWNHFAINLQSIWIFWKAIDISYVIDDDVQLYGVCYRNNFEFIGSLCDKRVFPHQHPYILIVYFFDILFFLIKKNKEEYGIQDKTDKCIEHMKLILEQDVNNTWKISIEVIFYFIEKSHLYMNIFLDAKWRCDYGV